jgi:hypothetical protein
VKEAELIAQQVSSLAERIAVLEKRLDEVERVNGRLEQAALTTARAPQEISGHWDAVYEAMQRVEQSTDDEEQWTRETRRSRVPCLPAWQLDSPETRVRIPLAA